MYLQMSIWCQSKTTFTGQELYVVDLWIIERLIQVTQSSDSLKYMMNTQFI